MEKLPERIIAVKTIAYDVDNVVDYIKQWFPNKKKIGIEEVLEAIDILLVEDDKIKGNMYSLQDEYGIEYD
jgi:hypothetical protein